MRTLAVIGLGNHALKNTLPALAVCHELKLLGCYSRDLDKAKRTAEKYQIKYWQDEADVYKDTQVDIIYIATPTGVHFEQIKSALLHNKHVFCEKSLVTSLAEAEKLCQLAREKQLVLAECFMYLYHNQYAQLLTLCKEQSIGEIKSITARFGYPHIAPDNIRYSQKLGGGALLDAAVYPLSFINAFSENNITKFAGHIDSSPGYEVDTDGAAFFVMKNGITAHALWGMGRDYNNDIQIWGSQGQIYVERAFAKPHTLTTTIKVSRNGQTEDIHLTEDNHFINMFTSFVRAIDYPKEIQNLRKQIIEIASMVEQLKLASKNEI